MNRKKDFVTAIIPAAGSGKRFNSDIPKQFIQVKGKPVLAWTLKALSKSNIINYFLVVLPERNFEKWHKLLKEFASDIDIPFSCIEGGRERWESVWKGLLNLPEECNWVIIHDGARPIISPEIVQRVFEKALEKKAAICAYPSIDTVKNVKHDKICKTLDRTTIWLAQTPQIFWKELIVEVYKEAISMGKYGTDDASLVEMMGYSVYVVEGDRKNIKITTRDDLEWFEWQLSKR